MTASRQVYTPESSVVRMGGYSLIVAAIGFMAVFSYLAATFKYPDVLDGAASDVLPGLLTLGSTGRAVWVAYALLPFLLIPSALGAYAALREHAPTAMRAALITGVLTAVSMFLGLARWPTLHWELAQAYTAAPADGRAAIEAVFAGTNLYLGNFIGEFVGEIALNAFFALTGFAMLRAGLRKSGIAGLVVAGIGVLAALRNVTGAVALIAEVNNYVLPVWLIALGVILIRKRA